MSINNNPQNINRNQIDLTSLAPPQNIQKAQRKSKRGQPISHGRYDDLIQIQYSEQTSNKLAKLAKQIFPVRDIEELRKYTTTKDYRSRIIYITKAERFEGLYQDENDNQDKLFIDDIKLENVVRVKINLISRKKLISLSNEERDKINPKIPPGMKLEWGQAKSGELRSISRKLADKVDAAYSKIHPGEVIFGVERIFNLALKNSRYFSQTQSSTPISEERPTTPLTSRKRPATSSENPHKRCRTDDNANGNSPEVNNNSNNNGHNSPTLSYPNVLPAANNTLPYQGNENGLYHYQTYPLQSSSDEQFRVIPNQANLPYDDQAAYYHYYAQQPAAREPYYPINNFYNYQTDPYSYAQYEGKNEQFEMPNIPSDDYTQAPYYASPSATYLQPAAPLNQMNHFDYQITPYYASPSAMTEQFNPANYFPYSQQTTSFYPNLQAPQAPKPETNEYGHLTNNNAQTPSSSAQTPPSTSNTPISTNYTSEVNSTPLSPYFDSATEPVENESDENQPLSSLANQSEAEGSDEEKRASPLPETLFEGNPEPDSLYDSLPELGDY